MASAAVKPGARYDGVSLTLHESMSGFFGQGVTQPAEGAALGRRDNIQLAFEVQIRIADLGAFFRDPRHGATLTGTVSCTLLGKDMPVDEGRFELFSADPVSGFRRMLYILRFQSGDGRSWCLRGRKDIIDDPGKLDLAADMTTLYTVVHSGPDEESALFGAGELYFRLTDAPRLLSSMKVEGAPSWVEQVGAPVAFGSFVWGALREEYFRPASLLYDTGYQNLVLRGTLRDAAGASTPFFFVSGVHDRGFPWGDGELFEDVLLVIGDGQAGSRFCITDRILEGLELDITRGRYRYAGPCYRVRDKGSASFSEMRSPSDRLEPVTAEIEVDFEAAPFDSVSFPFPVVPEVVRRLSSELSRALTEILPGEQALGIRITPHLVRVRSGSIAVRDGAGGHQQWSMTSDDTAGECEQGSFRNVREPTLLYGYTCVPDPEQHQATVQITAGSLRNERIDWPKDQLDRYLGAVIARTTASEMLMHDGSLAVRPVRNGKPESAVPFRKIGEPILEVNNDHYPTAVFQRRIVEVEQPESGRRCLALEEDMSLMHLAPIRSDRRCTVASVRGEDKFATLDRALDAARLDDVLNERLESSGKDRSSLLIAIKPNFMFTYDRNDHTTYTDPELVHHLVRRLRGQGFETIRVVEAQSTYGEYFDRRSVREVAEYVGLDGSAGYDVVDMTLDADEQRDFGPPLGRHPVSRVWREADFRISFAKNKTHSYAYYSLTLKNIYGALPLANKFREYHCGRGIYATTIDYLRAFPVHFGIIDAWISADGPFGVFADPGPNETRTIIAGADLVAVDWVGASKMGVDPMISRYMELAVNAFGKPRIDLVGDSSPYRPWLNVPAIVTALAVDVVDREYEFGNLMYSVSAQMDAAQFHHKSDAPHIALLRKMTDPMRRALFVRTGEPPSPVNRWLSRLFGRLGY